jgi:drug/metabolite transporter (DMT)-like permease
MSYVPPPPSPEPPRWQRREIWYGVAVGLVASLVLPFLALTGAARLGLAGVGLLAPVVVLVAALVLLIPRRTRQWANGLLIGFAIALIVGAGACVAILAAWNQGG